MEDHILSGLLKAEAYWKKASMADKLTKIDMAKELNDLKMFSLNQLAKIVRIPARELSSRMKAQSGGGRFEPETLSALAIVRRKKLAGESIPQALLQLIVEGDTSLSCACELTKIAYSTHYHLVAPKGRK